MVQNKSGECNAIAYISSKKEYIPWGHKNGTGGCMQLLPEFIFYDPRVLEWVGPNIWGHFIHLGHSRRVKRQNPLDWWLLGSVACLLS